MHFVSSALTGLSVLALSVMALAPQPARADEAADIAAIEVATARFQDVNVALAEGYIADPTAMCVTAAMEGQPAERGAMGIHYFRPDLLGITAVAPRVDGNGAHDDFLTPGVLVYEPQPDGSMVLVAVESLVFKAAWDAANAAPPSFGGHPYVAMVDDPATPADEAHGFMPHYELHLWAFRDNPNGAFEPFNPAATCAHAPMGGMTM